ncbi:MAG: hypothetical protein ACE5JP_14225 [Candidatus Bipolaricaulia bacterium]
MFRSRFGLGVLVAAAVAVLAEWASGNRIVGFATFLGVYVIFTYWFTNRLRSSYGRTDQADEGDHPGRR